MHIVAVCGIESESEHAFAGLHQLLRPALHLLDELPGPQADGLRAALGLAGSSGEDRFLVSAACLTLLSELAERRAVLFLADDIRWLDSASRPESSASAIRPFQTRSAGLTRRPRW
jgi:hypothetical protein